MSRRLFPRLLLFVILTGYVGAAEAAVLLGSVWDQSCSLLTLPKSEPIAPGCHGNAVPQPQRRPAGPCCCFKETVPVAQESTTFKPLPKSHGWRIERPVVTPDRTLSAERRDDSVYDARGNWIPLYLQKSVLII